MNKSLSIILTVWISLVASTVVAQTNNLCQLPEGILSKDRVIVYDKCNGTKERYDFQLAVKPGTAPTGRVIVYDIFLQDDGSSDMKEKSRHYFSLSGCTSSNPVFTVNSHGGSSVGGYLRVYDVNKTMGEVTIAGAIQTYSDDLLGMMAQWASESFWQVFGYDTAPEIDIRQFPIRLRK